MKSMGERVADAIRAVCEKEIEAAKERCVATFTEEVKDILARKAIEALPYVTEEFQRADMNNVITIVFKP